MSLNSVYYLFTKTYYITKIQYRFFFFGCQNFSDSFVRYWYIIMTGFLLWRPPRVFNVPTYTYFRRNKHHSWTFGTFGQVNLFYPRTSSYNKCAIFSLKSGPFTFYQITVVSKIDTDHKIVGPAKYFYTYKS